MTTTNTHLHVVTLGQLQFTLNGRSLTFRMSKVTALLVYLMSEADKAHGREQLATLLWPEENERKAAENLRQAIYQLRRSFGSEADRYLTVSRTAAQFNATSPHTLDTAELAAALTRQEWAAAAQLYQGDFLDTFYVEESILFSEWQLVMREQWRQAAIRALTQLGRQAEEAEDYGRATDAARRLLQLEAWDEEGCRLLMRLWARQGQATRAVQQYETFAACLAEELGATPAQETTRLYEQIRNGHWPPNSAPDPPAPTLDLLFNLPTSLTPLVGRETELAALTKMLAAPDCRLLTLTGTGGIGKTRLLLDLGWACHRAQQYADGVLFASLAELEPTPLEPVAVQIAHHLTRELVGPTATTDVGDGLNLLRHLCRDRELLLLLDNMEHLLDGATLLTELLTSLPRLTIVTTSREPLNLHGEWLYPLHGLPLTSEDGAARLFTQAARRAQPHFQLDDTVRPTVAAICHALDGHPLALEMAAASLRGLTLTELLTEVTAGLDALTTDQPNIPERQRDMRRLLSASWERLTPSEQTILAALSLFRQPFPAEAAQAVAGAGLRQMAGIVARSWLRRTADGRYQSHEMLRHFAREQLGQQQLGQQPHQETAVLARYGRYHLQWLAQFANQPLPASLLADLTARWVDVGLAWTEGIRQQMWPELAAAIPAIGTFYEYKGLLGEGIVWLETAVRQLQLALTEPMPAAAQRVWALLLIEQAALRNVQVQSAPVPALAAQAAALAEAAGDRKLALQARMVLAQGLGRLGQMAEMRDLLLLLLAQNDPPLTPRQQAELWVMLGALYGDLGEFALSEQYLRQGIAYYETHDLSERAASARHNLALTLIQLGEYGAARRLLLCNALFWRRYPAPASIAFTREGLGLVCLRLGRLRRADGHLRVAQQLYERLEDEDGLAYVALYRGYVALGWEMWARAERYFQKAIRLRQRMNLPRSLPQGWAGAAFVAWRRGDVATAQIYLANLIPALLSKEIAGENIGETYELTAVLLQEMGDDRAEAVASAW
jgi:DNA-binding SARP family transcriptional activator/predicted ATPase